MSQSRSWRPLSEIVQCVLRGVERTRVVKCSGPDVDLSPVKPNQLRLSSESFPEGSPFRPMASMPSACDQCLP